jgi:hypothetical protein
MPPLVCLARGKEKILKSFVLTTAILFTGALGYADNFTINNTGVGAAPTNPDPNWTVTTSPTPGSTNAFVTDTSGYPFGDWIPDTGTYGWDSPQSSYTNGQTDAPSTDFYYTTTFDLTGFDPTSALLQFQFAVDDSLVAVILNGNTLTGFDPGSLSSLSATQTINSDFVAGINTITFEAFNGPATSTNPTGLLVDFTSATANDSSSTPEPSAFLLIGAGLGGLGVIRRMRSC